MLKIWGRTTSVNVQKVLWCADELGLTYQHVQVGGPFGGVRDESYLTLNPNGLIPTLEDDDLVLWESNAIVRYLAARYGSGLSPADPAARAAADMWMDWQLGTIVPGMTTLFVGWIRTPAERRDIAALDSARERTAEQWQIVDKHLSAHPYLGGAGFTMGDIPLGAMAHRWHELPISRPDLPHLQAWYRRLGERPGYRRHVMQPLV